MSDISALEDRLIRLVQEFNEFRNTNPLERSSVRGGTLRFIGGMLILDTGATLRLIGTLDGDGNFHWSGPWRFDSANGGSIAGNVALEGDFDLTGKITADGIRIQDGRIHVGAGASEIIIDGADGSVTAGNVKIKDGKITVGTGASQIVIDGATGSITTGNVKIQDGKITIGAGAAQIVIDGATGKLTVGGMAIDPADGGKVTFPGGAQLRADVGNGIQMQIGTVKISAQPGAITLSVGTRSIGISSSGIRLALPTMTVAQAGTGAFPGAVVSNSSGDAFRVVPN